jgi:multidrug efflux pump subunit AcrB
MRGFIRFFVRYGIWTDALVLLTIAFGISAFSTLNRSFFPEQTTRTIFVEVTQPGASPQEMEEGVVLKVEEEIEGLEGLDEYTSTATENKATIQVTGRYGYDIDELLTEVKNAVDQISSFPENAEKPVVYKKRKIENCIDLILAGDTDFFTLKQEAERIKDDLIATDVISQVSIEGLPPIEISVEVQEENLRRYNLTFQDIANAVGSNNLDITGGTVEGRTEELRIRAMNKFVAPDSIGDIVVRAGDNGRMIRVADVAKVHKQFADNANKTLFNGRRAVTIAVNKLPEEDILEVVDRAQEYRKQYNSEEHPATLEVGRDRSIALRQRIGLLVENGGIGLGLVLIVLGLFLSLRLSSWVAAGLPISFMGMFIVIGLAGFTINMLSLFGMILVVGILVDDGIVIAENVYTKFEQGYAPINAAIQGTMEVLPAVFTSVSTTMLAFVPFFLIESQLGEFVSEMGGVVIACLAFSLIEAAIILPAHLVHFKALSHSNKNSRFRTAIDRVMNFLRMRIYAPVLRAAIRLKYITLALTIALFMLLFGLFSGGFIQTTFFPNIEFNNVTLNLTLQPGTPQERTEKALQDLAKEVWAVSDRYQGEVLKAADSVEKRAVKSVRLQLGQSENASGDNAGKLLIELLPAEERTFGSGDFAQALRQQIGTIADAKQFSISARKPFGKAVSISLASQDRRALAGAKQFLKRKMKNDESLRDVVDNETVGKREANIELTEKAYFLGLDRLNILSQIRNGFFGQEVQRLQQNEDEIKVWVRYPEADRRSLGELADMRIRTQNGAAYPLDQLVNFRLSRGIVDIKHYNGLREIRVEANQSNPNEPTGPINERIQEQYVPAMQQQFPNVQVNYKGQAEEGKRFAQSMQLIGPPVFLAMFVLVSLAFRSFVQALLVFLMIPVGLMFAMYGHLIEGYPLSILSMFGIVALSGVIINDAVVFMDRMNRNLRAGELFTQALYNAGLARFRAILLTSLTTVASLYPLILEDSTQAQFLVPMAISVAYGVLFVTVIVLLVFPALISIVNDIRVGLVWLWTGQKPTRNQVEPAVRERKRLWHEEGGNGQGNEHDTAGEAFRQAEPAPEGRN